MTPRRVDFRVAGLPAPQGSKTIARGHGGRSFVREDNPATAPWRNAVAAAAAAAMTDRRPLVGPLVLEATFTFPRPKAHYRTGAHAGTVKANAPRYCSTRPDLDKLVRAVADAITGVVCHDDGQLAVVEAEKVYGIPGAWLTITEL